MKHRKLIAALCAAAISLAQLPATATGIPVTASAAETGALAELPDWIPDDFDSAVEFRNSFGVTHIGNGLLCLVFTEEKETAPEDDPRYQLKATKNVVQCLRDEVYSTEQSLFAMRVVVYQPKMQGVLSVTHTDKQAPANENAGYSFLIEITDPTYHTLSVTETDIYSWLPDCRTEFDEYVKAHGNVSAKDNYVIFCLKSGIGTAYEWREKSQDYESSFDFCTASSCSMVSGIPVAGGSSYEAVVYQAVEDGDAKIEWEYGSFYSDGKITNTLTADCVVTDNAQTVLLPHMMRIEFTDADYGSRANVPSELEPIPLQVSAELIGLAEGTDVVAALDIAPVTATRNPFIWDYSQFDGCRVKIDVSEAALPKNFHLADEYKKVTEYSNGAQNVEFMVRYAETIKGDLNGDGEFGIADAVLLSKWLLGLPDAKLINWRGADFNGDNLLNAADLTLMKRELLRKEAFDNAVLIIDRQDAWTGSQHADAYTISMLRETPEIITLTAKLSQKADTLRDADWISWDFRVTDIGNESLILPLRKENSTLMLGTFGTENRILDDPDVQALARLLIINGLYGVRDCFTVNEYVLKSAPVAVSINQTGGIGGVRNLWKVYSKDGACYVSLTDKKTDTEKTVKVTEITQEQFDAFMSQDLTPYYNHPNLNADNWDAFSYATVFTYSDGSKRLSHADVTELRYAIEALLYGGQEAESVSAG